MILEGCVCVCMLSLYIVALTITNGFLGHSEQTERHFMSGKQITGFTQSRICIFKYRC